MMKRLNNKGQSLVEVVVSLGMIGMTVTALMSLVVGTKLLLKQSQITTKATALAQEGIEVVRHQRDIGCSFSNIKTNIGTLRSNSFVIQGDTVDESPPGSMPDESLILSGTTNRIENFTDFRRKIQIYELSDSQYDSPNPIGSQFQPPDSRSKYYFLRVIITNASDVEITRVETIMSKE